MRLGKQIAAVTRREEKQERMRAGMLRKTENLLARMQEPA